MNHDEVVEEDRRNKLPTNFEAKRRRLEWEEEQEQKKKVCAYCRFLLFGIKTASDVMVNDKCPIPSVSEILL